MVFGLALLREDMGDPACYRAYCPNCDRAATITDETCPECGVELVEGEQ